MDSEVLKIVCAAFASMIRTVSNSQSTLCLIILPVRQTIDDELDLKRNNYGSPNGQYMIEEGVTARRFFDEFVNIVKKMRTCDSRAILKSPSPNPPPRQIIAPPQDSEQSPAQNSEPSPEVATSE